MDMLLINFFHKGTYFSGFGIGCMIMVVILQVFMGIGMFLKGDTHGIFSNGLERISSNHG